MKIILYLFSYMQQPNPNKDGCYTLNIVLICTVWTEFENRCLMYSYLYYMPHRNTLNLNGYSGFFEDHWLLILINLKSVILWLNLMVIIMTNWGEIFGTVDQKCSEIYSSQCVNCLVQL